MEGIVERKNGETTILEVKYLSEDLKKKIQDELVEICHGEYALVSHFDEHSFEATVKELINYRIPKYKNKFSPLPNDLLWVKFVDCLPKLSSITELNNYICGDLNKKEITEKR